VSRASKIKEQPDNQASEKEHRSWGSLETI